MGPLSDGERPSDRAKTLESLAPKKVKSIRFAGKLMASVFCNTKGMMLMDHSHLRQQQKKIKKIQRGKLQEDYQFTAILNLK